MAQPLTLLDALKSSRNSSSEEKWKQLLGRDFGPEASLPDKSAEEAYKIHQFITEKIISHSFIDSLQPKPEKVKIFHLVHALSHASSIKDELDRSTRMDYDSTFFSIKYKSEHSQDFHKWIKAEKSLSYCQQNYLRSRALLVIADGYREDHDFDESQRVLKEAVTLALSLNDELKKVEVLKTVAANHLNNGEMVAAEKVTLLIPDYENRLFGLISIANRYISNDNFAEARRILKKAYDIIIEIDDDELNENDYLATVINSAIHAIADDLAEIFETCLEKNNLIEAENTAALIPINNLHNKDTFFERLVKIYKERGDLVNARRIASMLSASLRDEVLSSISDSETGAKRRRLESTKKDDPTI
jgi:hypothetical protein